MIRIVFREIFSLGIIIFFLFGFRSAVADWYEIPTGSMKPTIIESDRVFVNKIAYDIKIPFTLINIISWDNPKRGDIVVFDSPEDDQRLIKRVVGIPGDTIELIDNVLYINGKNAEYNLYDQSLIQKYWKKDQSTRILYKETFDNRPHLISVKDEYTPVSNYGPIRIEKDHYFMLGDNRDNSADSRYIGTVDRHYILGRAHRVFYSTRFISRLFVSLDE